MGNTCANSYYVNNTDIQTGEGLFDFKRSKKSVYGDIKEWRYNDRTLEHEEVKGRIEKKNSISSKRTQKEYKNGNVEVVMF